MKRLPNASNNLVLFKADLYEAHQFEAAIHGCDIVFHVATPPPNSHVISQLYYFIYTSLQVNKFWGVSFFQYKNRTEASVETAKKIAKMCVESGTVRRLIYTASVLSMSPMKDDGSGFKDFMDETCWTPLNLSYPFSNIHFEVRTNSIPKTYIK